MNDEIKEILEELENMYEISELEEQVNNINKIRDYITNLQQLEQEHKKINGELREENSKLEIALQNIQEDYDRRTKENERLKEELENKCWDEASVRADILLEQDDYKSRCEKINEILKESPDFNYSNDYIILKRKIEGILQGENNE